MVNTRKGGSMIGIRIDRLLEKHGRTFYWLSKETGVSHTTLWRLKKGKALGINFITLEKLCGALGCQPGDLLSFTNEKRQAVRKSRRTRQSSVSR
jgi:putative transcriptional regulator